MYYETALFWLAAAVIFGLFEAGAVSLVCLWFMFGSVFAFFSSFFTDNVVVQVLVFLIVSVLSLVFIRPVAKRYVNKYTKGGNINSKINKKGTVVKAIEKGEKGRVKIGDVEWVAVSENEDIPQGSKVNVVKIEGNTLLVKNIEEV